MADKIKTNGLKLIIDCGVDDFLIEPNRELHRRLVYNQTPHDYTEHPGGHTWITGRTRCRLTFCFSIKS
jgi:enterochelin esterase-like enzyme